MIGNLDLPDEADHAVVQFDNAKRRVVPENKYPLGNVGEESVRGAIGDINAERRAKAKAQRAEDDNQLRKLMVYWSLIFVGGQIVVCDLLLVGYGIIEVCQHHTIDSRVVMALLGTSLVEIIGILWVIARNLFPFHDKNRNKKAEKHSAK